MDSHPRIVTREAIAETPWVNLVRKEVDWQQKLESYYSLDVPDYIAIVALTPSGKVPFVQQYRPAVEAFTLELPAGTLETGETPEQCCVRELKEETGLEALDVRLVGSHWPDTGRLGNLQHIFSVRTSAHDPAVEAELPVLYLTPGEIQEKIEKKEIRALLHISALYLSGVLPVR